MKDYIKLKIERFVDLLYYMYVNEKLSDEYIKNFVIALKENGLLKYIDDILNKFFIKVQEKENVIKAIVESSDDLSVEEIKRIENALKRKFSTDKVDVLFKKIDDLIGGFRVIVNDKYLIDATFLKYVNQIKN